MNEGRLKQMKTMYAIGISVEKIAKTFGLTVSQVHILCKGVNRMAKAIGKDIIKLENNEVESK